MYPIFKRLVWILLLPVNLVLWLLRALLWLIALPFRLIVTIFQAPVWFFRWLYSLIYRRRTVPATILRMWQEPHVLATDKDEFVLFDSRGEKLKIRLNVYQKKHFFSRHAEGDVGTLTYRGAWLVKWRPASLESPVAAGRVKRSVFLSYAHEWKDDARFLARYFGSRNIDVWFDEDSLNVGDALNNHLIKVIQGADYFVPLLSQDYYYSEWCVRELETAIQAGRRVLPIKVEEGELTMPPHISRLYKEQLGDLVFIDLRKQNPYRQLDHLIAKMSVEGRPPQ